jgi:hydroxymethylglutaryl-CoA reductase (NADPH)
MAIDYRRAGNYLQHLFKDRPPDDLAQRLASKQSPPPRRMPGGSLITPAAIGERWKRLTAGASTRSALLDVQTIDTAALYRRNIEQFIGTVKLPVGIAGPLRVNGLHAQGDYYVPLATTEAALVASYSRGSLLVSEAGGCTAMLLSEGLGRAPGFVFRDIVEVGRFLAWLVPQLPAIEQSANATTHHGRLSDMRLTVEGNHVYLYFEFQTGDAAGQNMVTIATKAVCDYIEQHTPVKPQAVYVEANMSGDKKATAQSFLSVRGRKVTAEIVIPGPLVERRLHATPAKLADYWRMSALGGVMSGTMGIQGHYANGLAALYIACGQDAACVAESAVGVTRFEVTDNGGLYAAVTLPNLIVGTVGGGTGLPSQRACLEIMGLAGNGHARAFAEVAAALSLAGELSIIGALAAGDFTHAHQRLARGRAKPAS